MRRAADSLDAPLSLGDHLGQGRVGEVGEFHGLEARPQRLDRLRWGV